MAEEFAARAPSPDEADALHRLITRIQRGDRLPMVTNRGEVDDMFGSPDIDPPDDLRVVEIDGEFVAYGVVEHAPAGRRHEQAHLSGGVLPEWRGRGIGRGLLAWQIGRAEERLATTDPDLSAHLIGYAYDTEASKLRLLERHGFHRERFDHELSRELDRIPRTPVVPGITIRPWQDGDAEAARTVFNASFADHWGSTPRNPESWRHLIGEAGRRLDLSFVAVDDGSGDVVAIALNGHYPEDAEITGRLDGWIESLGTLRSHRKRGIASALVTYSMAGFAAAGFDHAMLGVDTQNPTGAYGIYEELGFIKLRTSITMRRTVREAAGQS